MMIIAKEAYFLFETFISNICKVEIIFCTFSKQELRFKHKISSYITSWSKYQNRELCITVSVRSSFAPIPPRRATAIKITEMRPLLELRFVPLRRRGLYFAPVREFFIQYLSRRACISNRQIAIVVLLTAAKYNEQYTTRYNK